MMRGENIVCFAKDWTEDPTSNNHVMKLLGRDNKVLWLNSIATRTPSLTSGRDMGKIVSKLRSFAKGPTHIEGGLDVYTPIVLPFPHSAVAQRVNEHVVRESLRFLRGQRGMREFQLWTFLPTAEKYVGKLGESLSVYYCTDEWSHFSYVDKDKIVAMERSLCERADLVFCTARTLLERKGAYNPNTFLASHGVDQAHFAKALDDKTQIAEELRALPKPILGFIGLVQDWVDIDFFAYLAEKRKDWSIVVVGKSLVDLSRLQKYPNIHLLGRKAYEDLPAYCKGFDVSLIPFVSNELTRNVNPIKLREYLSAGLAVVSTDIPEVTLYADDPRAKQGAMSGAVLVGRTHEELFAHCERVLREDSPERRRARSEEMKKETWEVKVGELGDHVLRVRERKLAARA